MSAKKSWDIAPSRPAPRAPAPAARPARKKVPQSAPRKRGAVHIEREPGRRKPVRERGPSLKKKRQEKRSMLRIVLGILAFSILAAAIYVLWLPTFRVNAVEGIGNDPDAIATAAKQALVGEHFFIIPRDSIFFIPESSIRASVMKAHPQVQAVSIQATGLNSLKVSTVGRVSTFTWCGESVDMPADGCYQADTEGLIFAAKEQAYAKIEGTSTAAIVPQQGELLVYGPIEGAENGPVRARVAYSSALPTALQFIKAMRGLNADIVSVTLRNDEIDLHTEGGTRITYVIGKEDLAATLAATTFPNLNLNDGSIQYVDLRFENKVYIKRVGE